MIAYLLLLAAATADKPEIAAPKHRCMDGEGTLVDRPEQCPAVNPPGGPFIVAPQPLPLPTKAQPAKPYSNPGLWVDTIDYPSLSLRNEEEGVVGFRLTVGRDGKVEACDVTMTSGFAALDAATCRNITRRARFYPALDDNGNPMIGRYSNRVRWTIPAIPSYAKQTDFTPFGPQPTYGTVIELKEADYPLEALTKGMQGYADVALTISEAGLVTDCIVEVSTGHPLLDTRSCEIAKAWTFIPAHDEAGKTMAGTTRHLISWVLPDLWKIGTQSGTPPKPPASYR